jgi:hypothetical protein
VSQRHKELKLAILLAVKNCLTFIGVVNLSHARVTHFIEHLEGAGYTIVKK